LQERNIDAKIINVLENLFSKTFTAVKWNNIISNMVPLITSVKQGGLLSSLAFSIFIDVVLTTLEQSGFGCFIGQKCFNSFMYADDLILLSITVTDLQRMFNLCSDAFCQLDLPINVSKWHCLRLGPRFNINCSPLSIQGVDVEWVKINTNDLNEYKVFGCYTLPSKDF